MDAAAAQTGRGAASSSPPSASASSPAAAAAAAAAAASKNAKKKQHQHVRMTYACEACRASKAKCEPNSGGGGSSSSSTEGICRRCFLSKRECIFRTGPRTRRRRSQGHPAATRSTPPPRVPSKTFTIDVPMPHHHPPHPGDAPDSSSSVFDDLRELHEGVLASLVPGGDGGAGVPGLVDVAISLPPPGQAATAAPSSPATASGSASSSTCPSSSSSSWSTTTTSTTSSATTTTHSFSRVRPQFNHDSATALLTSFREDMLPYFPVVALQPPLDDAPGSASTSSSSSTTSSRVLSSLARARPFVLLAMLAAASSARSLQGHGLYDQEFRKVLGLKLVSGGERSVELLVGLLIYCAWYPFHLRPKNRQAQQYMRMAGDLVRDLQLDEPPARMDVTQLGADEERMAHIRAYLSCYYLSSVFATTFQKKNTVPYTQWTEDCCRILLDGGGDSAEDPAAEADRTLVWLVRLGHVAEETTFVNARKQKGVQQDDEDPQRTQLIYKGLEAQLREWQCQMPANVAAKPVLRMANWATEILLYGQPLLDFPCTRRNNNKARPGGRLGAEDEHVDGQRLERCVDVLGPWFEYVSCLPASEFLCFTAVEWGYVVMSIIVGLRLSLPPPPLPRGDDCWCPPSSWDHAAARKRLGMETFFQRLARVGGGDGDGSNSTTDVLSASKVVVGVVARRYERRVAAPEEKEEDVLKDGCPMLDGSMDAYLSTWWEDGFVHAGLGGDGFDQDLWATMTGL